MDENLSLANQLVSNGAMCLLAFAAFWGLLRGFDMLHGVKFRRDILPALQKHPEALARYYGLRAVAVALLVGPILATFRL